MGHGMRESSDAPTFRLGWRENIEESMPLYHVWFGTKRRKWLLQGAVADAALRLMRDVAREKGIDLRASETMVDHVHLLVQAQDRAELSRAMNLPKGGSSYRLLREMPEIKLDAGVSSFWQHRYGAKEVPPAAAASVRQYIETQWDRTEKYAR